MNAAFPLACPSLNFSAISSSIQSSVERAEVTVLLPAKSTKLLASLSCEEGKVGEHRKGLAEAWLGRGI